MIAWWKRRYSALHGEVRINVERLPAFIIACACLWNFSKDITPVDERGDLPPRRDEDQIWMDVDEWPLRDFDPMDFGMF